VNDPDAAAESGKTTRGFAPRLRIPGSAGGAGGPDPEPAMSDPRLLRIENLFQEAADLPPAERPAFLDRQAGDDPELRAEIASLLDCLENREVASLDMLEQDGEPDLIGQRVGDYRVIELIGEGGFGSVFLAEQEKPIRRRVALKVIKLGMDTRQVIARFEVERQALAMMEHPNIARVLDAGATESGRPYFVMELVEGVPITDYCDRNALDLRARLALFVQVCHAVQHAHVKGVIHRDLKPTNVLVAPGDGSPVPKVIDFGVAKATNRRLTERTLCTEFRQLVGTPEYMSPEQAEPSGLDVDTRSDIYALGVLLYELLTGRTPFERAAFERLAYDEMHRMIREAATPTPSQKISNLRDDLEAVARSRRLAPHALRQTVRGELDWIVMKAIEKERGRRYETVAGLAADVEHYLNHEPVEAGPPSPLYRFRKYVRRHRVGVTATLLVTSAVVTGLVLATLGLLQATRARTALERERDAAETNAIRAEREADRARAVTAFLREMLESASPWTGSVKSKDRLGYIVEEAARKVRSGALSGQPRVEGEVRQTLGRTYLVLGRYAEAESELGACVALLEREAGHEAPETLSARRMLGGALRKQGRVAEAEALLRSTLEATRRVLGERHPETLEVMSALAGTLTTVGRYEESEALHRKVLEVRRRRLGDRHVATLRSRLDLGLLLLTVERTEEAEALIRHALETARRLLGNEHPETVHAMQSLASVLRQEQRFDDAERLQRETLAIQRKVLGEDHPETRRTKVGYALLLVEMGRPDRCGNLFAEIITWLKREAERPDPDHEVVYVYAWLLLRCPALVLASVPAMRVAALRTDPSGSRRYAAEAETVLRSYLNTVRLELGEDHRRTLAFRSLLAQALSRQGRSAEAVKQHRIILRAQRRTFGDEDPETLKAMVNLGMALQADRKPGPAEKLLRRALASQQRLLGDDHPDRDEAMGNLALVLGNLGRYDEAEDFCRQALALRRRHLGDGHPATRSTIYFLAQLLRRQGRGDEAAPLMRELISSLSHAAERTDADAQTLSEYARLLLSVKPESLRDPEAAHGAARRVVALTGGRSLPPLVVLAEACHRSGRLARAVEVQQQIVDRVSPGRTGPFTGEEIRLITWLGEAGGLVGTLESLLYIETARGKAPPGAAR